MTSRHAQLEQAYRATAYCVAAPSRELCLRVGVPSPDLDTLLAKERAETWAIITADNPRSILRSQAENDAGHRRLTRRVSGLGFAHFPSVARADAGDWPPERGLFLLAVPLATALTLAREFDQAAVLVGKRSGLPELLFCDA